MDQRVEQLEQNVTSLLTNQQQMLEKVTELFTKLNSFNSHREEGESSRSQPRGSHNQWGNRGSQQGGTNQSYAPRSVKLDFPRFNGSEDPRRPGCTCLFPFRRGSSTLVPTSPTGNRVCDVGSIQGWPFGSLWTNPVP